MEPLALADGIKLLVVDDHPESLLALEKILRRLPIDIFTARSGTEALSLMLRHRFSLVIIDVQMPGMSGFEVADLMQNNHETMDIPIIFVTAFDKDEKYIFKGFQTGAVDYLFKPIEAEILAGKVKVFLDLKKKQEDLMEAMEDIKKLSLNNKLVLDSIDEGILGLDANGLVTFSNPAAARMIRYTVDEIDGMHVSIFIENYEENKNVMQNMHNDSSIIENDKGSCFLESTFRCKDGSQFPVEYSYSTIKDNGQNAHGNVLVFQDITRRKNVEQKLIRLANYDPLTGVANRVQFHSFLENVLLRSKRHSRMFAIIFLDLDNFKEVNDTQGHDVGDKILKTVADRLTGCIRADDLVSRLGGDEFAIILDDIVEQDMAAVVAEKIIQANSKLIIIDGIEYAITSSIGIVTFPDVGDNIENLIKAADTAMYEAKNSGKNKYQFFKLEMQERVVNLTNLKHDLVKAVDNDEFTVYYQAQISAETRKIIGAEALLRWNSPERGFVLPGEFVSITEEQGLIVPIGEKLIETVFNQVSEWVERKLVMKDFKISLNLSIRQLKEENFISTIEKYIISSGINPAYVELELTETVMMDDTVRTVQLLDELHKLGIKIGIDDFGTGYSSLSYLSRLTIETLKIDRFFVSNIGSSLNDETIIKATIGLAHSLGLKVTAEGVETEKQINFLIEQGCDLLQGYYYSKPLDVAEAENMFLNLSDNKITNIKSHRKLV